MAVRTKTLGMTGIAALRPGTSLNGMEKLKIPAVIRKFHIVALKMALCALPRGVTIITASRVRFCLKRMRGPPGHSRMIQWLDREKLFIADMTGVTGLRSTMIHGFSAPMTLVTDLHRRPSENAF